MLGCLLSLRFFRASRRGFIGDSDDWGKEDDVASSSLLYLDPSTFPHDLTSEFWYGCKHVYVLVHLTSVQLQYHQRCLVSSDSYECMLWGSVASCSAEYNMRRHYWECPDKSDCFVSVENLEKLGEHLPALPLCHNSWRPWQNLQSLVSLAVAIPCIRPVNLRPSRIRSNLCSQVSPPPAGSV